ncbi:WhiB family transcriptional regulator [Streptomyces albus]|uniref:WhiB family transcriptional regulator n=1 Tax=Streptomyces albus TaxID=1888 RepID=UPI0024AD898A|nr:WhiB family transcriptional regulator [Streptomyces albus]MDI6413178.1 WhiB family transcriptional regulator [Streptomyces albus]
MSRAGIPDPSHFPDPDPRFPFPHSPAPTRCQTEPATFDFSRGSGVSRDAREGQLARARRACSACPIVKDCLKWALVNKDLTKTGVFAATTPLQRTALRKRMADRLGPDWTDVLAERDRARRARVAAARHNPLTISQARIVRLDREINGPMPKTLTPAQRQRNMARLMAGLKAA